MNEHPYGWLSLLPPLVAIGLAILTRRIVLSLVTGIFAGALMMARGDVLLAIYQTWEVHLWSTLIDPAKLRVFSFTLLMGGLVGVITRSGGMLGLIHLVSPWANNRRRGQLATWVMGLLVFFDDYANTILLGSTLRPICDRLRISREKLAYLVDSTAAPVAGIALVSTWVAVEIDYIGNGLAAVAGADLSPFGLFLASIPYRFYVITALLFVPMTAWLGRDFGPMLDAEQATTAGQRSRGRVELVDDEQEPQSAASWCHAVFPIVVTLGLVMVFIYRTGAQSVCESRGTQAIAWVEDLDFAGQRPDELRGAVDALAAAASTGQIAATELAVRELGQQFMTMDSIDVPAFFSTPIGLRDVVGAADSSLALQYGALAGVCLAILMAIAARLLNAEQALSAAMAGAKVVLPAVAILWTASAMSRMTTDTPVDGETSEVAYAFQDHRLYTAAYLTNVIAGEPGNETAQTSLSTKFLPTLVFLLAAIVAFCTGTSWGTMGILVPMVVQTAFAMLTREGTPITADDPILLSSIAGVLAGAVFGDHCSPISDTTVLSSQACGCDHIAHVWTQMPYALAAAAVSVLLGTLPIGFGVSVWVLLPLQLLALLGILRAFGKRVPDFREAVVGPE